MESIPQPRPAPKRVELVGGPYCGRRVTVARLFPTILIDQEKYGKREGINNKYDYLPPISA